MDAAGYDAGGIFLFVFLLRRLSVRPIASAVSVKINAKTSGGIA